MSHSDHFIMDQMQPDDFGGFTFVEVTEDCVFNHGFEIVPTIALGEDPVTQCPGVVAAFLGFGDFKDDFSGCHALAPEPPQLEGWYRGPMGVSTGEDYPLVWRWVNAALLEGAFGCWGGRWCAARVYVLNLVRTKAGITTVGCSWSMRSYPKGRFDDCDRILLNYAFERIIFFQCPIFHCVFTPGSTEVSVNVSYVPNAF